MSEYQLTTPVAFIIFNRPETTQRVFHEIKKAKPSKLLIVGDGPRSDRTGESEKVEKTRDIINQVDWNCEVLTNYSDVNLGCKKRVSTGINWVFSQVEEAIILEDDCLPNPTFFQYCSELLEYYRYDFRIGAISGDNFQFGEKQGNASYYFSRYPHIWGWASWRNRWQNNYDVEIKYWPYFRDSKRTADWGLSVKEEKYWSSLFDATYNGKIDTWDYQWLFAFWLYGRKAILPNVNLISNIGFSADGTHTNILGPFSNMRTESMGFPIIHPRELFEFRTADNKYFMKQHFNSISKRIRRKIFNVLKWNKKNSHSQIK